MSIRRSFIRRNTAANEVIVTSRSKSSRANCHHEVERDRRQCSSVIVSTSAQALKPSRVIDMSFPQCLLNERVSHQSIMASMFEAIGGSTAWVPIAWA